MCKVRFLWICGVLGTQPHFQPCRTIKEAVFKRTAFWVTDAKSLPGVLGGILVRGNLKGQADTVFNEVVEGTRSALGERCLRMLLCAACCVGCACWVPGAAGTPSPSCHGSHPLPPRAAQHVQLLL